MFISSILLNPSMCSSTCSSVLGLLWITKKQFVFFFLGTQLLLHLTTAISILCLFYTKETIVIKIFSPYRFKEPPLKQTSIRILWIKIRIQTMKIEKLFHNYVRVRTGNESCTASIDFLHHYTYVIIFSETIIIHRRTLGIIFFRILY